MKWLLILVSMSGDVTFPAEIPKFGTEQECKAARELVIAQFTGGTFGLKYAEGICVPTTG